jgi:hypothetical protein
MSCRGDAPRAQPRVDAACAPRRTGAQHRCQAVLEAADGGWSVSSLQALAQVLMLPAAAMAGVEEARECVLQRHRSRQVSRSAEHSPCALCRRRPVKSEERVAGHEQRHALTV